MAAGQILSCAIRRAHVTLSSRPSHTGLAVREEVAMKVRFYGFSWDFRGVDEVGFGDLVGRLRAGTEDVDAAGEPGEMGGYFHTGYR